ncbi:MAG TPA: hypothetical protein DCG41_14725, partial [Verrucomicrobiales bacterium]|nr:hypothetical protein [Verrucomicrobiales bacterium]
MYLWLVSIRLMYLESKNRRTQLGFTLVEIMVALVIFSIISL